MKRLLWKSFTHFLCKGIRERTACWYSSTATGKGQSAIAEQAAATTAVSIYKTDLFWTGPDSTALKTPKELYLH